MKHRMVKDFFLRVHSKLQACAGTQVEGPCKDLHHVCVLVCVLFLGLCLPRIDALRN